MLALKQGKKDENKGNLLVTVLTLLALITFPIFVFFFLKRMANSRAGQKFGLCNFKDLYVFYCKSRKYRCKY
jgi:flagellar biogenesis protein FliO